MAETDAKAVISLTGFVAGRAALMERFANQVQHTSPLLKKRVKQAYAQALDDMSKLLDEVKES